MLRPLTTRMILFASGANASRSARHRHVRSRLVLLLPGILTTGTASVSMSLPLQTPSTQPWPQSKVRASHRLQRALPSPSRARIFLCKLTIAHLGTHRVHPCPVPASSCVNAADTTGTDAMDLPRAPGLKRSRNDLTREERAAIYSGSRCGACARQRTDSEADFGPYLTRTAAVRLANRCTLYDPFLTRHESRIVNKRGEPEVVITRPPWTCERCAAEYHERSRQQGLDLPHLPKPSAARDRRRS